MGHAPEISSSALRFDVIAGLTAAAVVLPKAMAYATVAGLPVSVGLYTAFVPMIVYALLGTSCAKAGFFPDILSLVQHVPDRSTITLVVGGLALLTLFPH